MTVKELIEQLQQAPQDYEAMSVKWDQEMSITEILVDHEYKEVTL